jgi:hypothetical protein
MRVRIDEARCDDTVRCIDGFARAVGHFTDRSDFAVVTATSACRAAAPVPSTTVPFLINKS